MRRNDELTYNHSVKYGSLEVIQDTLNEKCRVSRPSEVLIRSARKMRTTSDEASVEPGNVDAEFLSVRMGVGCAAEFKRRTYRGGEQQESASCA